MKKSCFIRSVFVLTIVTGVIVYLVQTKWDSIKNMLADVPHKGIEKSLVRFKESPEKDTLKTLLDEFFTKHLANFNSFSNKMFDPLVTSLTNFSSDSLLDGHELNQIKQILKKIENEGSKKDRN
jgi:predicted PurR-regulated permease PerM